jgi:hypothetical protein
VIRDAPHSSRTTFFYKRIFPLLFFAIVSLFIEVTFCAPIRFVPFSSSPVINELIQRIDAARQRWSPTRYCRGCGTADTSASAPIIATSRHNSTTFSILGLQPDQDSGRR